MARQKIADLMLAIDRLERDALWHEERKADAVNAEREAIVRYMLSRPLGDQGVCSIKSVRDAVKGKLLVIADEIEHGLHHESASDSTTSSG